MPQEIALAHSNSAPNQDILVAERIIAGSHARDEAPWKFETIAFTWQRRTAPCLLRKLPFSIPLEIFLTLKRAAGTGSLSDSPAEGAL